ncbi:hypothetical protein BB558_005042 [Smittium angustum]|uniref:Uncharacterized protein n=1 Tax=Smittium angustum TaxID=133377 RepID=A0A2U1J1P8_SMIAN|nr:hypothetical protein BB558_005042 [Smittium angustum]
MITKISSYEILTKVFVLSRNPEVRFVSREFYEISTLNSVRASFLLKKFGKKQVFKISKGSFRPFPNIFDGQELVIELLERGADPESMSTQDLFNISIERGWERVFKYLLGEFVQTTRKSFELARGYRYISGTQKTKSKQGDLEYYIPLVDINHGYRTTFELAISTKQVNIINQFLNAYLIKPKLDYDESKTEILTHPKVGFWGIDLKKICDLLEQEGLDFLKLFYVNGFFEYSSNIPIFSKFCKRGNLKFVKFLVENGADIDENDGTPLKLAIENNHFHIVKYLIKRGAETKYCKNLESFLSSLDGNDSPTKKKMKMKMSTDNKYTLQEASSNGYLDIVKSLVENGANIHENNEIALKEASENGHLDIVKYLVEKGADIHVDQNWTLGMASKSGYFDVVKYLVEKGANIQARENFALGIACHYGHLDLVKYLIENGADSKAENHWSNIFNYKDEHLDVVDYLVERGLYYYRRRTSILEIAGSKGKLDIVKFLVENGVDVHQGGYTALKLASINGDLGVVKCLVENGVSVNEQNDYAVRFASLNGHLEVVKYLVENGANIRANNDEAKRWALKNKHLEVVKYLKQQKNHNKNF